VTVRNLVAVVAVAALAAIGAGLAVGGNGETNKKTFEYATGLWGDLHYSTVQADPGIPNLVADMNSQDISFSIHDGDLKAGNGPTANPPSVTCSNDLYTTALGWVHSLDEPAILTPGDNDWTDCDRPSNGGFNSLERLDHERAVLFSTNSSLGQKTLEQDVQSTTSLCKGYLIPTTYTNVPLCREPALDGEERHVRDAERPGHVQQPLHERVG
jgi:hypothetical protein